MQTQAKEIVIQPVLLERLKRIVWLMIDHPDSWVEMKHTDLMDVELIDACVGVVRHLARGTGFDPSVMARFGYVAFARVTR